MKAMKEETTERKQIYDDKDLSKLLCFSTGFVATNFFVATIPIIRYVTLPVYQFLPQHRQMNFICVCPLVCSLCKRCDNIPEKYGEKITLQQHNLTVHYFCLVSQTLMMCICETNFILESLSSFPV